MARKVSCLLEVDHARGVQVVDDVMSEVDVSGSVMTRPAARLVLVEPLQCCRIGEQHAGVEHVRADLALPTAASP